MANESPTSMLSPLTLASEVARPAAASCVAPRRPTKDKETVDKLLASINELVGQNIRDRGWQAGTWDRGSALVQQSDLSLPVPGQ